MTLIQLSEAHQAAGIEIDSLAGVFSVFHHGRGLGPVYSSLDAAKAHADDLLPKPVRTWTNIAAEYNATPDQRQLFSTIFEELNWVAFAEGLSMPMSPGLAIQGAIRELGVPRVDQIAWDGGHFGPYSVYGIQGHFTNGRSRIYVLDRGGDLLVLASEVWPEDDHITKLLAAKGG